MRGGCIALPTILGREDTQRQAHCRAQPERRHHVSTVALPDQSPRPDHGSLRSSRSGSLTRKCSRCGAQRERNSSGESGLRGRGRSAATPASLPRSPAPDFISVIPDRAACNSSDKDLEQKAGASVDAALGAPRAAEPQREPGRHRREHRLGLSHRRPLHRPSFGTQGQQSNSGHPRGPQLGHEAGVGERLLTASLCASKDAGGREQTPAPDLPKLVMPDAGTTVSM